MKRIAAWVLKRLVVAVAVLLMIAGFGFVYGYFAGPSRISYSCAIILIAWPWALPQLFVVVSLLWFVGQHFDGWIHPTISNRSLPKP
jgi:hypothetical protein